ncbi:Cht3 [Bugula neritina]|uniref:Cht3 n=1 Tax=Bugula neritina TaxID=10212 RepID=A0A7J7KDC6_BUGNE|nr:Cht3 [Bugula neritina]
MKILFACAAVLLCLLLAPEQTQAKGKVVCYYTNWSGYRQGLGKFKPGDIDPTLCTHILYAFTLVENNKLKIHDDWLDVQTGYFNQVIDMKKVNPSVKVMVAIGGWNNGGGPFSIMAKTANSRRQFIDSVLAFLKQYKFDGLDLDWEYPGLRGGDPNTDKQNFNLLIQELQAAFRKFGNQQGIEKPLLSAAVGPAPNTANIAYDRRVVCSGNAVKDLDFVNLMQYDIHGAWDRSQTGFAAPLYSAPGESTPQNVIAATTKDWIDGGCARDKLILGIPMYGRGWKSSGTSVPSTANGGSNQGKYTLLAGMLSYYEICEKLSTGWQQSYSSEAAQAIAYGEGQLVTYDNERSVKAKVDYLKSQRLGGAMIWSLDFDDFTGQFCNRGKYPLLSTINKEMGRTLPTPQTTLPPTTLPPGCTQWWCPGSTKPTTTRRTTRPPRSTTMSPGSTQKPSRCRPVCKSSTRNKFLANPCDPAKYYVCDRGNLWEGTCEFVPSNRPETLLACVAVLLCLLLAPEQTQAKEKVVCYYTNWSGYRQGLAKFKPKDIDPTLCTHILYSFTLVRDNKLTIHDDWLDVQTGYFNQVIDMKKLIPSVKVMVAIGGWNNGGTPFSVMVKTANSRRQFIDSVLEFLKQYKFDGLDLDWEYPGLRGGDPDADKQNLNLLVQELQAAFKQFGDQQE